MEEELTTNPYYEEESSDLKIPIDIQAVLPRVEVSLLIVDITDTFYFATADGFTIHDKMFIATSPGVQGLWVLGYQRLTTGKDSADQIVVLTRSFSNYISARSYFDREVKGLADPGDTNA